MKKYMGDLSRIILKNMYFIALIILVISPIKGNNDEVIIKSNEYKISEYLAYNKIEVYSDKLEFYSNLYNIDKNIILDNIISSKIDLTKEENVDLFFIDYIEEFLNNNKEYVNNDLVPYEGTSEYVEALIGYFTTVVYPEVDYNLAVSIGAAETGYYSYKPALRKNNIYGGLSNGKMIRYKNIEYGVLTYVRLLNNKYYAKGLDTKEEIGYYYCPTTNDAGQKVASGHWISLVSKAQGVYNNLALIDTIEILNSYK